MDLLLVKLRCSLNNVFSVLRILFSLCNYFIDLAVRRLLVDCFVGTSWIIFNPPILLFGVL